MKCILLSVLWLMISLYFANANNWCIQTTRTDAIVTKILTKTVTSRNFWRFIRRKTVTYAGTELVPRIRQHRVCCEGYILDSVYRICEPNCPLGCPQFSGCVKPNSCECQSGYQMNGDRCETICESTCAANAFCSEPNTCICKSGFEYNYSTKSCESPVEPTTSTLSTPSGPNYGRNAQCSHAYNCTTHGHCIFEQLHCECNEGFVKADSSCHLNSGIMLGECIEESLCKGITTGEYKTSTIEAPNFASTEDYNESTHQEPTLSNERPDATTLTPTEVSSSIKPGESIDERPSESFTAGEYTTRTTKILSSESSETLTFTTNDQYSESIQGQVLSSERLDTTTLTSTEVSSNCESGCFNGICRNGLCQCLNGSVFSQKSNSCIINISCDTICHNGICHENGLCECPQGFVYEYNKGCVPHCNQKCIKGICVAPETCKCIDGFKEKPESSFECIPAGKLSEKLERHASNFTWLWVVSTILIIAIFGLFILKKARKHDYNVNKVEEGRHIVKFDSKCELMA